MTADLLSSIRALADLPGHIAAVIPIALFVGLCLVCMVPSIAARMRGQR